MANDKKRSGTKLADSEPRKRSRKSTAHRVDVPPPDKKVPETGGSPDKQEGTRTLAVVGKDNEKNSHTKNRLSTAEREMYSQMTAMFVKVTDPPAGKKKLCLDALLEKLLGARFFDFQSLRVCSAGAYAVLSRDGDNPSRDDLKKAIKSFKKTATPFRLEGKTVKYEIEVFGNVLRQVVWRVESVAGLDLKKEVGRPVLAALRENEQVKSGAIKVPEFSVRRGTRFGLASDFYLIVFSGAVPWAGKVFTLGTAKGYVTKEGRSCLFCKTTGHSCANCESSGHHFGWSEVVELSPTTGTVAAQMHPSKIPAKPKVPTPKTPMFSTRMAEE